jgi:LPS-assembly protein
MNIVSSFVFRQVYEEGFNLISSPIEHSLGFVTSNQPRSSINFLYNRTAVFFPDQPSVAIRKFPGVEAAVPSTRVFQALPVYFDMETGWTGLARRDSVLHSPSFAERVDIYPKFTVPILVNSAIEWSARAGLRETAYTHSIVNNQVQSDVLNRFAADFETRLAGPHLERSFGGWRHIVEPSVIYRYVTGANRFQDTIVVDDVDLFANTNEVEYALTNRVMADREILSWRLAQKVYFDPTFGGAITPGRRNVVTPLLGLTGFAFADGKRRISPLVSTLRVNSALGVSTDLQVDYDTVRNEFRDAGIISGLNRGQVFSNVAYFFTRRSAIQAPNNQIRLTFGYGNNQKRGLSTAFGVSYDVHRSLFQQSALQLGYNTDCYGLSLEFTQFDIGSRKESRIRFAFSLKDIGSFGTIRPQERLF